MGRVADGLAPRPLHEQRGGFYYNGANFHHALSEAERLGMDMDFAALTQASGRVCPEHLTTTRPPIGLFERLADHLEARGNQEGEAAALPPTGDDRAGGGDFAAAEQWYRKSLAISEKQGNEHGAALTYHQLGMIAQERRDFAAAEQWYRKSLAIKEKQGNEHGAAITYHQLGMIAEERRDFAAAEQWYRKSLAI